MVLRQVAALLAVTFIVHVVNLSVAAEPQLKLQKGDHVVLIGNTLAERMQYFGNFETNLHSRFPELELVVRNLGWSADEVALRPRSQAAPTSRSTAALRWM